MKVLVLNCGSSSVKFELIETSPQLVKKNREKHYGKGLVDQIGGAVSRYYFTPYGKEKFYQTGKKADYEAAINWSLAQLVSPERGVLGSLSEISAVGHRVVHGGEKFTGSVLINPEVLEALKECIALAPLHNPHNIRGYEIAARLLPGLPQAAVFDTAFHSRMPEPAYLYPLPYQEYRKNKVRRYGFHGTSHRYVSQQGARLLKKDYSGLKIITVHLGNGCSMAAIRDGYSIDTSMGFTPLEGLMMGTRCGDIDPAIVTYLMAVNQLTPVEISELLNKKSGLYGVSGISNDMRDLFREMERGNMRAKLAVSLFCYRIKKYIGAYCAALGGLDLLIFTAGIGENQPQVRESCCEGLEFLGIKLDKAKNCCLKGEGLISSPGSKVKVMVIPTREELLIARETVECVLAAAKQ